MENQLWQNTLGCSNQNQESPQDAEDILFLLLGLIIFVNISINVTTVIWRGLQSALDKLMDWMSQKNEVQAIDCCPKAPPAKTKDVRIHCTLDPVKVKMAQPERCSSSSSHYLRKCSSRSRRSSRRRNYSRGQRRRRCSHQQKPWNHRQFSSAYPLFQKRPRSYKVSQLRPMPFFDMEDRDFSLEEDGVSFPRSKYPRGTWGGVYKPVGLASNVRLWGRQGGILASLPAPSIYLSPELRRLPKRVEAKSELRLQTFNPPYSQAPAWGNVETEQWASPQPPRWQLPNPACVRGSYSPYSSAGHTANDVWDQRRRGAEGSEPPTVLVSRNPRPEIQGYREFSSPQAHRRNLPGYAHSQPNYSPPQSMGHLCYNSRESHEVRRRMPEWTEIMPNRHPLTTSTSLTAVGGEISYQRTPAASPGPLPHSSQPLPEAQCVEQASAPPAFVPLSRNPGGNVTYQVYDSLELKRQVQENRGRASSLPPPSTSASKPSLHRSRTGKLN